MALKVALKVAKLILAVLIIIDSISFVYAENFTNSVKDKKTAAIIYQLYFFIEFNNNTNSEAQFCFIGEQGLNIGKIIQKTHKKRSSNSTLDLQVSNWKSPATIPTGHCHIIYSENAISDEKEAYKTLSRESMTITDNPDLAKTGNTAAISFKGTSASFIFSRKKLRRASFEVNHQLIRASNVVP